MAWKAFFRTWGGRAGRGEPAPALPSALCARPALGCAMGMVCGGRGGLGPASVRQEPLEEVDGHQHETDKKAALLGTPGSGDRRDHQGLFLKACRLTPPPRRLLGARAADPAPHAGQPWEDGEARGEPQGAWTPRVGPSRIQAPSLRIPGKTGPSPASHGPAAPPSISTSARPWQSPKQLPAHPRPPGPYRGAGVRAHEVLQQDGKHLRHQLPGA